MASLKYKYKKFIKKLKKYEWILLLILAAIIIFSPNGVISQSLGLGEYNAPVQDDGLILHFIDVGQGDATFIELGNGETMLIDAGPNSAQKTVTEYIRKLGYRKIDYVIASHPHEDHIGGMDYVLRRFSVGTCYLPDVTGNTYDYDRMLDVLGKRFIPVKEARAGIVLCDDAEHSLKITLLSPTEELFTEYADINDLSAICRIDYGDKTVIAGGDATSLAEDALENTDCDILKVSHHGSSFSSSYEYLSRITPEYAVISCALDNDYGHPHDRVLRDLARVNAKIYRTDEMGTVIIKCDGKNIAAESEK